MILDTLEKISDVHHECIQADIWTSNTWILSEAFSTLIAQLQEKKEFLATIQTQESGKPIKYSVIEIERCIAQLRQAITFLQCGVSKRSNMPESRCISLGVVLAITTFSSPYSSFFHKVIPAIICGDTFVFSPSPKVYYCSEVMFLITENCLKKYFPDIEKSLICINTKLINSSEVLDRLRFDYVLFTGKSETAYEIKKKIGRCHGLFETGSCAMAYVDETIRDIETLAEKLVSAAFSQTGMRCIGLKNLFIHEHISKELIENILECTKKIHCGDPLNSEVMVGPIFDQVALTCLYDTITWLKNSGYSLLAGGFIKSNLLMPTILLDESQTEYSIKEMYGPILCIHVVENYKDISQVYYRRSSLNTAFFSESLDSISDFINYCNTCGTICINCGPDKRDDELPFGGFYDENDGKEDLETLIKELSIEQKILYGKNAFLDS